jgi:hypothetical protein
MWHITRITTEKGRTKKQAFIQAMMFPTRILVQIHWYFDFLTDFH